ncbi:Os06g0216966 [Oryza sativa Japonica Group]|uniref:Os06g0216966 protein n=1 Tax=Oryza sativa subsp. japonica TaxID=39947 RepID=A0A0P0WU19_ORYSJ|nr:Os06g0216966 [Oryza sativa Japonica Group]
MVMEMVVSVLPLFRTVLIPTPGYAAAYTINYWGWFGFGSSGLYEIQSNGTAEHNHGGCIFSFCSLGDAMLEESTLPLPESSHKGSVRITGWMMDWIYWCSTTVPVLFLSQVYNVVRTDYADVVRFRA